jgi:hypothetical protein
VRRRHGGDAYTRSSLPLLWLSNMSSVVANLSLSLSSKSVDGSYFTKRNTVAVRYGALWLWGNREARPLLCLRFYACCRANLSPNRLPAKKRSYTFHMAVERKILKFSVR